MSGPTTWTNPEIELLTREWLAGNTAKNIAILLGSGKSRNAVIGKAHRLGLMHPFSPGEGTNRERAKRKQEKTARMIVVAEVVKIVANKKARPPKFFAPAQPLAGRNPIAITKLRKTTCRAIVGHDDSIHHLAVYCGDQVFPGKPYCPVHCKLFFRPYEARRLRA